MEAPKPNLQFIENSSINLKDSISEFKLNFGTIGDSIYFELIDLQSFPNIIYRNIFNFTQLQTLNLWFKQFSSIEKVIKMLNKMIQSNNFKIKNNSNNQNNSKTIYFVNLLDEEDCILIELKKIEQNQNDIIQTLLKTVKDLKEENSCLEKKMDEKIESMNKKIIQIEKENNSLKLKVEDLIQKMDKFTQNNNKLNENCSLLNNSLLINEIEEERLINSWISPNKSIKYNLLYRATKDGDKLSDFHRLCDEKGPTLVIGKTPGGYVFGGFTKIKWKSLKKGEYFLDPDAFVFSLNQKRKFNIYNNNKVGLNRNYGPIFGNGSNSLQIEDNILSNKNHWSNPNGSYGKNLNLTEGNRFSIIELEVFLVNY